LKRRTELLVLAGGFGTRLRRTVPEVPKALAPVGGRPYLHYLVESWLGQGVTDLTFLLHHQAEQIEAFLETLQSQGGLGCSLRTLIEQRPLGTGGAIAYAVHQLKLNESFLVANADTWLGCGITEVTRARNPAMAVVEMEKTGRYGSVQIDADRIVGFDEKRDNSTAGWINAGLYHLNAGLFKTWDGSAFSLEREVFEMLARDGELTAVPLNTDFIDIGVPDDYLRFCNWIQNGRREPL
jgi:D-glycero-alpha-D-manno-heptose 1-phosphate guanylyltransferase